MAHKASELAKLLDGSLEGGADPYVTGIAKIEEAKSGDVSFLANPKYDRFLETTQASVVIVSKSQKTPQGIYIRVADPYSSFAKLLKLFNPPEEPPEVGVHSTAVIGDKTSLGDQVRIGPLVAIGRECQIGDNVTIYAGTIIGDRVAIGKDTVIRAGVSIRIGTRIGQRVIIQDNVVIGSDGFGFAPKSGGDYEKIPQVGIVVIDDDVEIGAGCTIDRATMGTTRIEKGVKLDNLIQVAHNVTIGENTVIAAQTGISGSTKIGKYCMVGGQVGFGGHIEVGDGTLIGAQSGVARSFPPKSKLFGYPAQNHADELRVMAATRKLPQLVRQIDKLEKEIAELRSRLEEK